MEITLNTAAIGLIVGLIIQGIGLVVYAVRIDAATKQLMESHKTMIVTQGQHGIRLEDHEARIRVQEHITAA